MNFNAFTSREDAAIAAANFLCQALVQALSRNDRTTLIVSGGSSPHRCLEILSQREIEWARVNVALTDERLVPVGHSASNETMVREKLLQGNAAAANFCDASDVSARVIETSLACCLVGMGEDGHFASIFPDNPDRLTLLDPGSEPGYFEVQTEASEYRRMTANLSLLLRGESVLLLVFGEKKKQVLQAPDQYPVNGLLDQNEVPVHVYWAP